VEPVSKAKVDPKKANPAAKSAEKPGSAPLPAMLELALTLSSLLVVSVPVTVGLVAYFSGASLMDIVLRSGVTLLVVGVLTTAVTRMLADGALKAFQEDLQRASQSESQHEVRA
jgi:hypothetical protein